MPGGFPSESLGPDEFGDTLGFCAMDPTSQLLAIAVGVLTAVASPGASGQSGPVAPLRQWTVSMGGVVDVPVAGGPPGPNIVDGPAYHSVPERSARSALGLRVAVSTQLSKSGAVQVEHERVEAVTYDRLEPPIDPYFHTHHVRSTYRTNQTTFLLAFRPERWHGLTTSCLAGFGFERSALVEDIYDRSGTKVVGQHSDRIAVPTLSLGADAGVPLRQDLIITLGLRVHILWTTGYARIRPYAGVQWCIRC